MHALVLNMIWPALWVSGALEKCWFLIFATVIVEAVALNRVLTWSWKRSFAASATGNVISGAAGVLLMPFLMLFWHLIWAWTPLANLDQSSLVPSFILMCLGSAVIEYFVVKRIFGSRRFLFLCLLIGNLLTYTVAATLLAADGKFRENVRERIHGPEPREYGAFLNSDGDSILTFWNKKKGPAVIRLLNSKDRKQVGMGGVMMQGSDGAYSTAGLSAGSYIVEMSGLGDTVYSFVIIK